MAGGILSVNPSHDLLPASQDMFSRALQTSKDLYGIMGQHYENKFRNAQARNSDLEAQRKAGTLESDINAGNTKNQTDIQYYPQMQAAKLAQEGATIKEIQARTGLSYAEAGAARARATASYAEAGKTKANTSPIAEYQELYNAYINAKPGSREQLYYGGILKDKMGKYGQPVGSSGNQYGSAQPSGDQSNSDSIPPTPQGGSVPTGQPGWEKDPKFGSNRMGAGGTYTNPETGEQISTPTNSTTTKNQTAIQSLQRVTPLIKDLSKNMSQFQTVKEKGKLESQKIGNLFGGNYDLPNQKAQADQDLALAPESLLKAYMLNVTDQSLNTMKDAIKPMTGETKEGYEKRLTKTLGTLRENEEEAKKLQAQGFDVTQPGATGQGAGQQYKDPFYDAPAQQVASGFNGNPNVPKPPPQQNQAQPQIEAAKSINGSEYVKINGKWYHK